MERLDAHLSDHPAWFVLIYQTTTRDAQQEILLRLSSLCSDDLCILGSSSGPDHFVIAECSSVRDQRLIDRVVSAVDHSGRLLHTTRPLDLSHASRWQHTD